MILSLDDIGRYPKITYNPIKNGELYTHQRLLVSAAMQHEQTQAIADGKYIINFGFINDITGAGKTVCIIAMTALQNLLGSRRRLKYDLLPKDVGAVKRHKVKDSDYMEVANIKRKTLVIVPTGLATQWDKELTRFSTLKHIFIDSSKTINKFDLANSPNIDIVLCKSSMLKKYLGKSVENENYHYSRVFIDECDSISVSNFPYIRSDFYWFVSATCEKDGLVKCKNLGLIRDTYTNMRQGFTQKEYPYCQSCQNNIKAFKKVHHKMRKAEHPEAHCLFCFHLAMVKHFGHSYPQIVDGYGCNFEQCKKNHYRNGGTHYRKNCKVREIMRHVINTASSNGKIDPKKLSCKDSIDKHMTRYCTNCVELRYNMNYKMVKDNALFRNDPDFVTFCTKINEPIVNIINCLTPKFITVANRSGGAVSEDIVRMINSGDHKAAAAKYGISIKSGENIVLGIRNDMMRKIKKEDKDIKVELDGISALKVQIGELNKEIDKDEIKALRMQVTNAKNRIKTKQERIDRLTERLNVLTKNIKEVNEETCGICIEKMNAPTMVRCCKVLFCYSCIHQWLIQYRKKSCPYCRNPLNITQVDTIVTEAEPEPEECKGPLVLSKEDSIQKLFKDVFKPGAKVLIFTEQDGTIDNIERVFKRMGIKYIAYRKTMTGFTNIVNYTHGDVQAVLLNSVSHGAGLNLQMTSDVILYHRMAAELEVQAIGRAQRPGRKENLRIWRLAYEGEYPTVIEPVTEEQ